MRKTVLWVFLTIFIVMAMILASCKTETTSEESTIVTGKVTSPAPPATKPPDITRTEKPQYGAIVTLSLATDITGFDEAFVTHNVATTLHLTNEELLQGDWTKGAAGTGEADFTLGGVNNMYLKTGCLADTWEIPERGKMVFHIREGVLWHYKAPTDGREITVDDVVFSLQRMCTEPGAHSR